MPVALCQQAGERERRGGDVDEDGLAVDDLLVRLERDGALLLEPHAQTTSQVVLRGGCDAGGAAVHAPQHSLPVKPTQVLADAVRCDVEVFRKLRHRDAPALRNECDDGVLPFSREHGTSIKNNRKR